MVLYEKQAWLPYMLSAEANKETIDYNVCFSSCLYFGGGYYLFVFRLTILVNVSN